MNKFSFILKSGTINFSLAVLVLFFCTTTWASPLSLRQQTQQQITGTVSDASGPLPAVTVTVKGKTAGTLTDQNGYFSITAAVGDTLVFSFMGYSTIAMAITNSNFNGLTITMKEDATALKEVTVNAGYYSVKEKERTGSIAKITSKDIEKQPVTNVLATMQGRMAGVDIVQDSGVPGGAFQIKIRGQNSLRADGNQPLYIIDGVPYSSETIGTTATSGTAPSLTSPLNSINPADIESLEVLKDADATAIYGSRGANGVVLITTKKGKKGKTTFTVNSSSSAGRVTLMPKLMNTQQYLAMRQEAYANDGVTTYPATAYDVNGTWDANRYTDWQKELIGGTATIDNLQASVTGGSDKTQYLLSGTYRTETTVFPGDFKYNKGAAHFSMNHSSPDDRFRLQFSGNYTAQQNRMPAVDLTAVSRLLAPNAPALYDASGNLNWENSTWVNPLAGMQSEYQSRIKDLNANVVLSYQLPNNLFFKTSLGYTDLQSNEGRTQPHTMYNPAFGLTSAQSTITTNRTNRSSWIIEPQLNWSNQIGAGKLDALLGGTLQKQMTERVSLYGMGFSSNSLLHNLSAATTRTITLDDETEYKYQAFFARINYNFKDRYILNLTGRRDGSSRFGPGKQFATFGAVGAAWVFSKEGFLSDSSVLSFGKLRTSYGITGNDQIGDYQFIDTYSTTGITYQGVVGLQPTRLYNPAFGWEMSRKFEVALETGFFNDRLFLTSSYYFNRSSNQLVGIPLPSTTGFSSLTANLGATVENSGLEFTLRTVNFQRKSFEWTTSFTISANRNRLVSYPGLEQSTYANLYVVGESINLIRLYYYTGRNATTGFYEFEDVNGDGVITAIGDRKAIADLNPDFFGGLQNQFRFKGFQLDFLFQFVKQQAFTSMPGLPGQAINQLSSISTDTSIQPFTVGNPAATTAYSRYVFSNGVLQDASFIRLKNVSLTYDLPLKLTSGIGCQLFLQGQNVLTFTKYASGDPEARNNNYLPPLRVFSGGVKLTF